MNVYKNIHINIYVYTPTNNKVRTIGDTFFTFISSDTNCTFCLFYEQDDEKQNMFMMQMLVKENNYTPCLLLGAHLIILSTLKIISTASVAEVSCDNFEL